MAYSSVHIDFNTVPNIDDVLNISETSLGLTLNKIFKDLRYEENQVEIPYYEESDGFYSGRYYGFISTFYKTAFDLDHNATSLFTVTAVNGAMSSGLGSVTITANYPGAVFVLENTSDVNATVTITNEAVVVPPPDTISFYPTAIAFAHAQNDTLPSFGIAFAGDLWKIVGKPNFLLSSATPGVTVTTTGSGAALYQTVSGSGDALVTIALTNYFDSDIVFSGDAVAGAFNVYKNNVLDGTISYTVAVSRLSDSLTIPYVSGQKAFTLDTKYFIFESENTNTYFQFDAMVKTYDFFTNTLTEIPFPQKIVLFKGQQKAILGQLIHRLMRRFPSPNDALLQYKEATVKITCSEKLLSNDSVIRSGISAEIPFLAGLSKGITNFGFLEFNTTTHRVTKNSFAYLNFITPSGSYELRTFKNGTLVGTAVALPASTGIVFCKKVSFSNYTQGDRIQFVIDKVGETNTNAPKKSFVVFPEGNFSNHIVWENEFLLQSAIECTGTAAIIPEGEFQTQTIYVDLVEKLVNISSTKNVRLNINTGWLSSNDIDTIESLMRAKRAWLIQGDTFINLVPTSKKLPPTDLQTELIQFELEFKINQNYNEETYSL